VSFLPLFIVDVAATVAAIDAVVDGVVAAAFIAATTGTLSCSEVPDVGNTGTMPGATCPAEVSLLKLQGFRSLLPGNVLDDDCYDRKHA
jgi:hypothetical protein